MSTKKCSGHLVSSTFGLTLGDVFDKSMSTAFSKKNGFIIYQINPPEPNAVFDIYRVALTHDNRIHSIYATGSSDRETAIMLKELLISTFKIEYDISDDFTQNVDNITILFQGDKAITIDIKDNQVSIMFMDMPLAEKALGVLI